MKAKRNLGDWIKVLLLLFNEAVVLALIIFLLKYLDVKIPLAATVTLAVVSVAFLFIIHIKVMPVFHRNRISGQEGMLGLRGEVLQSLTPVGFVGVKGERWKAEAIGGHIETGMTIEVVGLEGLKLKVRRVEA
jgi:membrane-bound serine protease (ClpP class)